MKIYTCVGFKGIQPTCTAAIVVAPDIATARTMLEAELKAAGMPQDKPVQVSVVSLSKPMVEILANGDY